jgi:hypothetical protein
MYVLITACSISIFILKVIPSYILLVPSSEKGIEDAYNINNSILYVVRAFDFSSASVDVPKKVQEVFKMEYHRDSVLHISYTFFGDGTTEVDVKLKLCTR